MKKGATATGRNKSRQSSMVSVTTESTMTMTESKMFKIMREYSSLKEMVSRFIVVRSSPTL